MGGVKEKWEGLRRSGRGLGEVGGVEEKWGGQV